VCTCAPQDDPPQPRDEHVEVICLPGGDIYVKSFCGTPRSGEIISRGTAFMRQLQVGGARQGPRHDGYTGC
jgi:hypothetical protein